MVRLRIRLESEIVEVIYATGEPGLFEFAVAKQRGDVPVGATVFAICTGDRVVSQLDEWRFAAMSDVEYYNYMALLRDASKREERRLRQRNAASKVRRFINWLSGPPSVDDAAIHHSGG